VNRVIEIGNGKSQSSETFHRWHVLAAVEVGNFIVYIDTFIVNLALPWMMKEFGVPVTPIKWVVVAYLLSLTVMLLTAGRITDIIGLIRLPSLAGMALLTISSGSVTWRPHSAPWWLSGCSRVWAGRWCSVT